MGLPPVIYEDQDIIAFDKPSGLLIAPDRWDKKRENLMDLVHDKMGHHVANVHRLDFDTSGIVLCAKNKPALDYLSGQFQGKTAQKHYTALSVLLPEERAMKFSAPIVPRMAAGGLPETFTVEAGIGEDFSQPGRMRVFRKRGGKPSVTEFRVLENFGRYLHFECKPLTGRTHQIRLHLAAAGAPILNDPFYGDPTEVLLLSNLKRGYKGRAEEKPLLARLALHAARLVVSHPATKLPVELVAPTPHEFEVALKYLRKYQGA